MIDRHDLEELRDLKKEIDSLKYARENIEPELQVIYYKDYRFNPKGTPKTDAGLDWYEQYKKMTDKITAKQAELWDKISQLEFALGEVESSEMRTILRYYYRDGMSQKEIARILGYETDTIKQKIWRFWGNK